MPCTHKSEVIVCQHVTREHAEVEILLVNDGLTVDYALCISCGSADDPEGLPFDALCRDCARGLNVPTTMPTPGKWQVRASADTVN